MKTKPHPRPRGTAADRAWPVALALLAGTALAVADTQLSDCTFPALSDAIEQGGVVTFGCSARIYFANTLVIRTDTTLEAAGRSVILDGRSGTNSSQAVRLFTVNPGVRFTINGLALVNGRGGNAAGAIHNQGTLILNHCLLSNHVAVGTDGFAGTEGASNGNEGGTGSAGGPGLAASAGAILNVGTALITQCQFVTNTAFGGTGGDGGAGGDGDVFGGNGANGGEGGAANGGAIMNQGTLRITNSVFQLNSAVAGAGGLGGTNGSGAFPGFRGNGGRGGSGSGGAILSTGNSLLSGCTFADNIAYGGQSADLGSRRTEGDPGWNGGAASGGGLWNYGGATLLNCTFSANAAVGGDAGRGEDSESVAGDGGDGGSAWGGNLFNGGATRLTNCTLKAGATLPGAAGEAGDAPFAGTAGQPGVGHGANASSPTGAIVLMNCILAAPSQSANADGTVLDGGYNLSSDATPTFTGTSRNNRAPRLGALGDNGGPTPTLPLLTGSPAIDAGHPTFFLPTDQRGVVRPRGPHADIGSFELTQLSIDTQPVSQTVVAGGQATFFVEANGDPPLTYQWRLNGTNLVGKTSSTLVLTNVIPTYAGVYSVVVQSGTASSVTSSNAALTVITLPVLVNAGVSSNQFRVSLLTSSNQNYRLEYKAALDDGAWLDATNRPGTGGSIELRDPQPVTGSRFYRVRVE